MMKLKKAIFFVCLFVVFGLFKSQAQTFAVIKFSQLKEMMERRNDTTYVFNFWATWCGPCVKEFPDFQKLSRAYQNKKIRFVFISLDFKKDFETVLLPFLKKNYVIDDVFLLDEPDYNSWIDKVEKSWMGDLPSTLIINNGHQLKKMYPHEFTYEELDAVLKPLVK